MSRKITYFMDSGFVNITGPGGFTEFRTTESQARAIAEALGVPYELRDR